MPAPAPLPGELGQENWANRTLYHCDNLPVLRGINSETVDLIATDPPFNKGRDFHATPDSLAAGASFQDRWTWEKDIHETWTDAIKDDHPAVWEVIDAANKTWGNDMGAYLCFMGVRLLEMHRVLKPTGSLYLHCDPTASHYLKLMLDGIFGRKNFRNEIVWYYKNASRGKQQFAKSHDLIFWYSRSPGDGVFNRDDVLAPYESKMTEWRYKKQGKPPPAGKTPDDVIVMPSLNTMDKERTGYPTQKPLALYDLIIKASSNKGDIVLDPFCGCATTVVAAELCERRWVGIDIWNGASETVKKRLQREVLDVPDIPSERLFSLGEVTRETGPPDRTDKQETAAPSFKVPVSWRSPLTQMTRAEMARRLQAAQAASADPSKVVCAGCGRALEPDFMHLDHVTPKADGGDNYITNRVLLCGPCNTRKGAKRTISGMRADNKDWITDRAAAEQALAAAQAAGRQALSEAIAAERGRLPLQ